MDFLGSNSAQSKNFEKDINTAINSASEPIAVEGSSSGWSIPWYLWLIFILLVAFIGFNIFLYLAKGKTNDISNFFSIIMEKINF